MPNYDFSHARFCNSQENTEIKILCNYNLYIINCNLYILFAYDFLTGTSIRHKHVIIAVGFTQLILMEFYLLWNGTRNAHLFSNRVMSWGDAKVPFWRSFLPSLFDSTSRLLLYLMNYLRILCRIFISLEDSFVNFIYITFTPMYLYIYIHLHFLSFNF